MRAAITDTDQQRVRDIMTSISNMYVRQNVERRSAQAQESLNFLQRQLPQLQQELNTAEDNLNRFRQEHESLDLTTETENLLGQMVDVEKRLSELQMQRAEMAQNFAPQHPSMQALDAQLRELKATRDRFEQRAKGLPETQQQVLRLQREVEVKTALYTALLNQAQELQVAKAGTIGNVRIVDQPLLPLKPVSPNKPLVMALILFLGLLLGMGAVFLRRALHAAVHGPDELEHRLGIPIYGVIPHSREEIKQMRQARRSRRPLPVLAQIRPNDLAVEGLRSFRTGLHFGLMNSQSRIILMTGPSPGVGKSFISVNSAHICGEAGMRVLLIDADMRRGQLHGYHDGQREPGLSDLLAGDLEFDQVLRHMSDRVDMITMGTMPPNPSELLMSHRFADLLQKVGGLYDLVIIDAPPVMAVTDAALIAPLVGAVFVVVRAELNTVDEIEITIKRIQQSGARVTGLVFNDLGAQGSTGRYGAYYYYRYDYNQKNEKMLADS
jgi:tyrosine-protein kinase Etk/Wzc